MIDIEKERLIPLNQAGRHIPGRAGKPISRATLWRWALKGRRGVRLESLLLSERMTSFEAIQRFVAKLNGLPTAAVQAECKGREAKRVEAILAAEGL